MGDAVAAAGAEHGFRLCRAPVDTDKSIPGGVIGIGNTVCPKLGIVVAPLAVFRLVIDHPGCHLHLAGGEIALEIGGIIHGIPETELRVGEDIHPSCSVCVVGYLHTPQQAMISAGDKHLLLCGDSVLPALKNSVSKPVAAGIGIQLRLHRLPGDVPYLSVRFQIDMESVLIQRTCVVAIAGNAAEACIFIEGISAGCVGQKREKVFTAQIIDPGKGCTRGFDNIFPFFIIKMAKFHVYLLLMQVLTAAPEHGGRWHPVHPG